MSNIFDQGGEEGTEGMFDIQGIVSSDRKMRKDAARIARLKSTVGDADLGESYNEAYSSIKLGTNPKDIEETLKHEYLVKKNRERAEYIFDNASNLNPEVQQSIHDTIAVDSLIEESVLDDDGINMMYSEIFAGETLDHFRQRGVANKSYILDQLEENFEDNNMLETAGNFIADMLAPDEIKDMNDYATLIGTDWDGMLDEMAIFQTLDPEEQKVVLEERMPAIIAAADNNPFVARSIVELYYADDIVQDIKIKAALDFSVLALDIGPIIGSFLKLGKNVAKGRSAVKELKDLDNPERAGAETAMAGGDKTDGLGQIIDMNKVDVASTANPTRMEGTSVLNGAMDDIASDVQEARKSVVNHLIEDLLPTAGNKLSRGESRKLKGRQRNLEHDIKVATESLGKVTKKQVKLGVAKKSAIKENIARMQAQLDEVNATIGRNVDSQAAYADISRLQQGIIPAKMKTQLDNLVKEEMSKRTRVVKQTDSDALDASIVNANSAARPAREQVIEAAGDPKLMDSPEAFGMPKELVETIEASVRAPMQRAAALASDNAIDALSPEDMAMAQTKASEKMKQRLTSSGKVVDSVEITGTTDKGFKITARTNDGKASEFQYDYTLSDNGTLTSDPALVKSNITSSLRGVFSPDVIWREMLGGFIKNITFAGQQSSKLANAMSKRYIDIEKGLSKTARIEVDTLLQAGDEAGTVFTHQELRAGTVELHAGAQGVKKGYSDEVIEGYFKKRAFFDELHGFRNEMMRGQLEFMGYKNVKYTDKSGAAANLVGKTYDNLQGIRTQLDEATVFVPDNIDGRTTRFVEKNKYVMDQLIEEGYRPVKLMEPIRFKGGKGKATWAMVRGEQVGSLPKKVLNYSAGYTPRIYRPGYFYVKNMDSASQETLYAFKSKGEAQAYATKTMTEEGSEYKNLAVREDREFSDLEKLTNSSDMFGGLYTSARKSQNLMVKTAAGDVRPERLNAANATQRYIQGISDIMPINTYRMSMVEQWMNTVDQVARAEGRAGFGTGGRSLDAALDLSPESMKTMKDSREYLKNVLKIPSDEEHKFADFVAGVGRGMERNWGEKGGKANEWILNNLHSKDPLRALKGATFNLHLGWFNVRQLWVQAQNASIALSMHPVRGAKAIAKLPSMRAAILSDNPEMWRAIAKSTPGIDEETFVKEIQMFKDSGIMDAIVRTADFDANVSGIGMSSMNGLRKASKAGRIFYEEGELASRIVAWDIARSGLIDAGEEVTAKSLTDETIRMHMNLQSENAAAWQTGVLGIPTQFVQVFAKFAENLLPKTMGGTGKWTAKEKASVLAGQFIIYGTVGVPIIEDLTAYAAEMLGMDSVQLQKENPMLVEGLQEGLWGMFFEAFGVQNNFSESGNLLAGVDDNIAATIIGAFYDHFSGNPVDSAAEISKVALGAGGNTVMRGKDAAIGMYEAAKNIMTHPSPAVLGHELLGVVDGLAGMTSTWSNARKAFYSEYYGMGLRSKRGTVMMTTEELGANWQTNLARAFGFETDKETALWKAYDYNTASKNEMRAVKDDLQHIYNSFMRSGNVELYRKQRAAIMGPYENTEAGRKIIENFNKSVLDGKSAFSREASAFTKDYLGNGGVMPLSTGTLLNNNEDK